MRISKRVKMLFISISIPLLFVIAFALVTATYSHFHRPLEVEVMTVGFVPQTVEISEGETIHFMNRSSTMTQFLCLGMDRRCDRFAYLTLQLPPPVLQSPGVQIAADQAKDIVFDTDGTFPITSTVVPNMNLTVQVNASG